MHSPHGLLVDERSSSHHRAPLPALSGDGPRRDRSGGGAKVTGRDPGLHLRDDLVDLGADPVDDHLNRLGEETVEPGAMPVRAQHELLGRAAEVHHLEHDLG